MWVASIRLMLCSHVWEYQGYKILLGYSMLVPIYPTLVNVELHILSMLWKWIQVSSIFTHVLWTSTIISGLKKANGGYGSITMSNKIQHPKPKTHFKTLNPKPSQFNYQEQVTNKQNQTQLFICYLQVVPKTSKHVGSQGNSLGIRPSKLD
jgi:hypothetical protein